MSNIAVVNFNSGEVSQEIDARKDTEKYTGACRRLENMIPDVYGNATKRPGTEAIVVGNGAACYYEAVIADPNKTQIYTAEDLKNIEDDYFEDYELMNNINLTSVADWEPIGFSTTDYFQGTLDGNDFTISNMTVTTATGDNGNGLFYGIEGSISNLRLDDCIIEDGGAYSTFHGILAGYANGAVFQNVYVNNATISVISASRTGGFVGDAISTGCSFISCAATVTVNVLGTTVLVNGQFIGGLVGRSSRSPFTDCYGQLTIVQPDTTGYLTQIGGFAGQLSQDDDISVLTNCYGVLNIRDVIHVTDIKWGALVGDEVLDTVSGESIEFVDCYWDSDKHADVVEDSDTRAGCTGKSTSDMYKQATFTNWDFSTVWQIVENTSYPTLQWQDETDTKLVCIPV